MTAPRRLIEADDELERDLIRSAHADRPSHRALERMLLGLGVELSHLPSAMASPTPGVATSGKIAGTVLAKWLVTGVAIGVAAISGAQAVGRALEHEGARAVEAPKRAVAPSTPSAGSASYRVSPGPREGTPSMAQTSPSSPPSARPRAAASPAPEAAGVPFPLAFAPVASEPSAVSPGLRAVGSFALETAQAPPASLAAEMRVLDAARRVLASGDPRSALATLVKYEQAFPNGALRPEASVLKVRALLAAGDRAGAEALGQRIIEHAPRSEHADAVRAALGPRSNP